MASTTQLNYTLRQRNAFSTVQSQSDALGHDRTIPSNLYRRSSQQVLELEPATISSTTRPARKSRDRFQNLWGTFRGTAITTLGSLNPFTGGITNVASYRTAAIASIGHKNSAGGITERNPFTLSISSSSSEVSSLKTGSFSTFSAIPFNFRGGFLAQYWTFRYSGKRINGQLTDTNAALSLAANAINAPENFAGVVIPSQFTINAGSTIAGQITRKRLRVRLQGVATGLVSSSYAFVIDIVAQR